MLCTLRIVYIVGTHVLAENGKTCSDLGHTRISTLEECKSLIGFVQSYYPSVSSDIVKVNYGKYPAGCYMFTIAGALFSVRFNADTSDNGEANSRPVCSTGRSYKSRIDVLNFCLIICYD